VDQHADEPGRVILGVFAGVPPGNVSWRADYPYPAVVLCGRCMSAVAEVMAHSPQHRQGGGPPIEAEEARARQEAARRY
jgi:hypothetical protein